MLLLLLLLLVLRLRRRETRTTLTTLTRHYTTKEVSGTVSDGRRRRLRRLRAMMGAATRVQFTCES